MIGHYLFSLKQTGFLFVALIKNLRI